MQKQLLLVLIGFLLILPVLAQEEESDPSPLPITEDVNYEVRPSDTLDTIGALFDVSPSCLADINNLDDPGDLRIGQTLLISVSCPLYGDDPRDDGFGNVLIPRTVVTYEDDCEGYRVERRDTMDVVAQEFDVSIVSLVLANDFQSLVRLEVNDCLAIPDDGVPYGAWPAVLEPVPGRLVLVEEGQTLDDVAQEFDVALAALEAANGLGAGEDVPEGTVVLVPNTAPPYGNDAEFDPASLGQGGGFSGVTHVVQPGDVLDLLAAQYDVDTQCLIESNVIAEPPLLQPGQVLIIPPNCGPYTGESGPALDDAITPADDAEDSDGEAQPLGG